MKKLLPYVSEAAYVKYQAKVEAALVRTLAKQDICSHEIADEVERASEEVTAAEVYEEQSRIRHNIRSLVNVIRRKISPEARPYVHLFATSRRTSLIPRQAFALQGFDAKGNSSGSHRI